MISKFSVIRATIVNKRADYCLQLLNDYSNAWSLIVIFNISALCSLGGILDNPNIFEKKKFLDILDVKGGRGKERGRRMDEEEKAFHGVKRIYEMVK